MAALWATTMLGTDKVFRYDKFNHVYLPLYWEKLDTTMKYYRQDKKSINMICVQIRNTVIGSYPALHEKGYVGSILKSLFGYNGNPSLIEVMSCLFYITPVVGLWRNKEKNKRTEQDLIKGQMELITK